MTAGRTAKLISGLSHDHLVAEVRHVIDQRLRAGESVPASWVVHAVVLEHAHIQGNHEGDDTDWYRRHAYENLRTIVREIMRTVYAPHVVENRQLVFAGLKYVKKEYLVLRDGEQHIVPVLKLRSSEGRAKVRELRAFGQGCFDHADELELFLEEHRDEFAANGD